MVELRGRQVWIAGAHPRMIVRRLEKVDPNSLSRDADLRILLCHFPRVIDRLEPGRFDLVLAGHMHDGQICVPYPGGKIRLAHPTARYVRGVYRTPAAVDARLAGSRDDVRAVPASPRARRRRSWCSDGATLDLWRASPRSRRTSSPATRPMRRGEVDGVRGLSESSIPGRRGGVASAATTPASASSCTSSSTGAHPFPRSGARSRSACASTSCAWRTSSPPSVDVIVDEIGPRQ